MGSLNNAATAIKRNSVSAWLNTLTAFREEHCRQSKRKLDVLYEVCFQFISYVLDRAFASPTVNVIRIKAVLFLGMVCLC